MLNAIRPLMFFAALALAMPVLAEEARAQTTEVGERIRQVEREGGQVLRAERMQRGGEDVYRIKVLTPDGRVRVMHDQRKPEVRPSPRTDRRSLLLRERARSEAPSQRTPEIRPEARELQPPTPRRRDD